MPAALSNRARGPRAASLAWALPLLLGLVPAGLAQEIQLAGFAGWRLGGSGRDPISAQDIDIADGPSFGGSLAVGLFERSQLELYFSRAETEADRLFVPDEAELAVSHLQLGFLYELGEGGAAPFAGASVGAARLSQADGVSRTRLSLGAVAGVRFFATRNLGLRADGRLLFIVDDDGGGRCPRPGGGEVVLCGGTIIQGELTAGIVLAF